VLDLSYQGNGEVLEVQRVLVAHSACLWTARPLTFFAIIMQTKQAIESLSLADQGSISINYGGSTACAQYD
jgi:hypothetical protein